MADALSFSEQCYLVGRMLQVQPTAGALEAFARAMPEFEAPDVEAVEQDYLRLFVGLGMPLAPPWESAWASDARLLFQRQTLDVRYWYRSVGLQAAALHHEPDDHIGLELEFVGRLAARGDFASAAGFAREHPLAWAPRWAEAVSANADLPFYPGLARRACKLFEHVQRR